MSGYSIVSKKESKETPYPYVYLFEDGTYQELSPSQRSLLEKPFHPGDGARPYVLSKYSAYGESGFLYRRLLPPKCKKRRKNYRKRT